MKLTKGHGCGGGLDSVLFSSLKSPRSRVTFFLSRSAALGSYKPFSCSFGSTSITSERPAKKGHGLTSLDECSADTPSHCSHLRAAHLSFVFTADSSIMELVNGLSADIALFLGVFGIFGSRVGLGVGHLFSRMAQATTLMEL